ncbi:hypothetical protein [Magnetospirillum sp. UT-4]|uniref:hypothetical protein n=1 Tax=Magnetospirillum sp. UT-4 TaxID=2681467 RepID=UPI00137FCCA7|nr:hypothetical protein [Magnetospirillum sp. UT-4]CAA7612693.1 conserved hypothetical protein [Magnetospirillum sp. UT-4]
MAEPLKTLNSAQLAWMEAWNAGLSQTLQLWRHLFDLQQQFLCQAAKHQRSHVEIARGPALTEKYGKRAHDIDPERDV